MADFNPYREWLGVTTPGQPPDHYALLGLKRFEDDLVTIRRAADAQKSRVRSVRPGPHAAQWSRILDQLEAARDCLTSSDKKSAYDHELRKQPLPEESVLDDPLEQAPTAASSIVADSADSDAARAAERENSAAGQPQRAAQPVKNLLPPGFGPEPKSDGDLPVDEPEPEGTRPVESLTKNILPPTFGPQQPEAASASPASAPCASNPTVPKAEAPIPSAPIVNPAPFVGTSPTQPTANTSLPQNPAPVATSPSAPMPSPSAPVASPSAPVPAVPASPTPMGNAFHQPAAAPAGGYVPAPQTPQAMQAPLAQFSPPQPQRGDRDDDDLLPPMAIPIAAASAGSTTSPSAAAPYSANLASPVPVAGAPTGAPMSGPAFGAPMGGFGVSSFNQPIGLAGPAQLTGPSYGDAFGAVDPRSGSTDFGASSPMVTAQTPSSRAAAGRSKLSTSSLVAIAASLVLLLAAGGIFVRNRLAGEQNPEVTSLDGLGGSNAGQSDGSPKVRRPRQPEETANSIDRSIVNDAPRQNVRPATFERPIDNQSPVTPRNPIDAPSPEPMPSPRPLSDPLAMPNPAPAPATDPSPVPDPGPTPDPGPALDPRPALEPSPPLLPSDPQPSDPSPVPTDSPANPIAKPMPDPMPGPAPMAEPEPALSAKHMIDFEWTLKEIRGHLTERDVYTAKALIGRAKEIAKKGKPGPHMEKLERLELLTHYVEEFWGAVLDGLPSLEGKDLEVGSTVVHIQQVSQNTIAYRAKGQNFKKQRYEWPSGLVRAVAENWLDKQPKSKIFIGAFMAVDKSYSVDKAREQWEKALAGDAETVEAVQKVMPVLNEL